jgi:pectin methylesterase-like acyl-CoA thioesterase
MIRSAAAMGALMVCGVTTAADLHVPSQYGTIQAAVDAASNGDEIVVAPGTYANIRVAIANYLSITLRASGTAEETILEGDGQGPVIRCGAYSDVDIEGFTITGGGSSDLPGEAGGITCMLCALTLSNCVIAENSSSDAGALTLLDINYAGVDQPVITGCDFSNNSATSESWSGGAIWIRDSNPTITNCTFSNNSAPEDDPQEIWAGDIFIDEYDGAATITNCDFCGNGDNSIYGPYSGSGNTFLDECPQACPDANDDGDVGIADLLLVLEHWLGSTGGDVDDNGLVELEDLVLVLENWGPCN